jgi:hypothetical protein
MPSDSCTLLPPSQRIRVLMSATTTPTSAAATFCWGMSSIPWGSTTLVPSILEEGFTITSKMTVPSMTPLRVTWSAVHGTRFVFTYSMAYQHFHRQEYLEGMKHGVAFLRNVHRNPATGGYAWVLRFLEGKAEIEDAINHCYGLAFVLLAYSYAPRCLVPNPQPGQSSVQRRKKPSWQGRLSHHRRLLQGAQHYLRG